MNAMKRKVALLCFTIGTHAATGQVNTFEKLQQQLTAPTETYEVIKQGADSLITAWHAANPNSTDYAPSEKAYLRWDMLAHSRHYIIGQPQVGINNLKTQAANLQLNYSYCTNGPTENPLQSLANQAQGAVKHHANTILRSYGMGTPYIEPMSFYTGNNNKQEEITQRPSKPKTTFTLFPNPAKDYVELRWNWFEMGLNNNLHVEFYTISGQLAAKQAIANYQNNIAVIPTVGLPTGLYLVNVVNDYDEVLFTEKLTINK
jgi:hypothetical protein